MSIIRNILATVAVMSLFAAAPVAARVMDTAPIVEMKSLTGTPSEFGHEGYIPMDMEATTSDLEVMEAVEADEANACPAIEDGTPATIAAYKEFVEVNTIPYVEMRLGDFANDPDVLMAIGPAPDNMQEWTLLFADPDLNPDFVEIYVMIYDDKGCFYGYLPFDPALVRMGLDGK